MALLIILGFAGIWIYNQLLRIEKTKIELLEQQIKDLQSNSPDIVVERLAKRYKILTEEIEILSREREQDNKKISELQSEKQDLQRTFDSVQEIIKDMDLPREGKFRTDIEMDILETIRNQNCVYIPVGPFYRSNEIDILKLKNNTPFLLEVVFPGMFKMYMFIYDNLYNHVGHVSNPYFGIYDKDYFVTLLHFLDFVPFKNGINSPSGEGEARLLFNSNFHSKSTINPDIFYIKIPFDESWLPGKG